MNELDLKIFKKVKINIHIIFNKIILLKAFKRKNYGL